MRYEIVPDEEATELRDYSVPAVIAFAVGIMSLCAWVLPVCGIPVAITGSILAIIGRRSSYPHIAGAGFVLCALGFTISLLNAILGVYAGATGRFPY